VINNQHRSSSPEPLPGRWRSGLRVLFLVCLSFALPHSARADAGIPMLLFVWPAAWILLVPVILIEALVARRVLALPFRRSLRISTVANLWSTFLGIPLTWLAMLAFEYAIGGIATALNIGDIGPVGFLPFSAAWIGPVGRPDAWLVPAAALVLCVPFFFMSVWVEYRVVRRSFPEEEWPSVKKWSWTAHSFTYAAIAVALGVTTALKASRPPVIADFEGQAPITRLELHDLQNRVLWRIDATDKTSRLEEAMYGAAPPGYVRQIPASGEPRRLKRGERLLLIYGTPDSWTRHWGWATGPSSFRGGVYESGKWFNSTPSDVFAEGMNSIDHLPEPRALPTSTP
jgi:hypothetical protein